MHIRGQMSFKEIARVQDVSINTVLSRYRYGLEKLRSLLQSEVELLRPTEKIEQLIKEFKIKPGDRMPGTDACSHAGSSGKNKNLTSAASTAEIWRTIMKSRIPKFAVAHGSNRNNSVSGILPHGSVDGTSMAWGDVVQTHSQCSYGNPWYNYWVRRQTGCYPWWGHGSRIRRTVSNMGQADIIIDLEQKKLLTLDREKKTAVYIGLGRLAQFEKLCCDITRLNRKVATRTKFSCWK